MNKDFIYIDGIKFSTKVAITELEQSRDLMYKEWPPPIMIFPYKNASVKKFWMKNTPSPLDIIFCCENKVVSILKGEPFSTALVGPDKPVDLVIELPFGTAEKNGFHIGSIVRPCYSVESAAKLIKFAC